MDNKICKLYNYTKSQRKSHAVHGFFFVAQLKFREKLYQMKKWLRHFFIWY